MAQHGAVPLKGQQNSHKYRQEGSGLWHAAGQGQHRQVMPGCHPTQLHDLSHGCHPLHQTRTDQDGHKGLPTAGQNWVVEEKHFHPKFVNTGSPKTEAETQLFQ